MTINSLSASGVKKFVDCPKQYYLHYVEDYPVPEEEDNEFLLLGSDVHNSIEDVLNDDSSLREQQVLLERFREEDEGRYPSSKNDQAETCFETAAKYVSAYVGDDIQAIEDRWTMDYKGMELVGYCDLVEGGKIIDWKTGSSEDKELQEKIQAAFYIKLYENEYGELPEMVDFAYIDEGTRSTHKRITDDGQVNWNSAKNEYWMDVEKIINQILRAETNNEWDATPESANCYFCQYKLYCQDSPFGAENVERKHIDVGI